MTRINITILSIILLPSFTYAEKICSAKYIYSENKFYTTEADYSWMKDFRIYSGCKKFCEDNNPKDAKTVECKLAGEHIENSKYKNIFMSVKNKICTITMIKAKDGSLIERFEIQENAKDCNNEISKQRWCKDGTYNCSSKFGS